LDVNIRVPERTLKSKPIDRIMKGYYDDAAIGMNKLNMTPFAMALLKPKSVKSI
jgi:hypothetical protein